MQFMLSTRQTAYSIVNRKVGNPNGQVIGDFITQAAGRMATSFINKPKKENCGL